MTRASFGWVYGKTPPPSRQGESWLKTRILPSFWWDRKSTNRTQLASGSHIRAMRVFIPRFLGALLYLLALTVAGVVGYSAIEGWELRDALYMTVITLTAVGYAEVLPLSQAGRNFRCSSWPVGSPEWESGSPRSRRSS